VKKSEAVRTPGGTGWHGEGIGRRPTKGWALHLLCGGPPGVECGYELTFFVHLITDGWMVGPWILVLPSWSVDQPTDLPPMNVFTWECVATDQ
jgi:hypothetical protein